MSTVHQVAVSGFGEGTNDVYDRARPSYPPDALQYIHEVIASSPYAQATSDRGTNLSTSHSDSGSGSGSGSNAHTKGWKIIEPGSGTGIFSRLLIAPPSSSAQAPARASENNKEGAGAGQAGDEGAEGGYPTFPIDILVGVEPSSGMRNAWARGLEKMSLSTSGAADADEPRPRGRAGPTSTSEVRQKRYLSVEGSFDDFQQVQSHGITKVVTQAVESDDDDHDHDEGERGRGGGAHAVIIAQAWHWCPDHEAALREIAAYLPPGSPLILIWNLEGSSPAWQASIRSAYQPYDLGTPQYYKGWWRKMFETEAFHELFGEEGKEEWQTEWSVGLTEDQLIERQFSKSYLTPAHLSDADRVALEGELRRIIREGEGGHEWSDEAKGIFKYRYNTDVVVLRRKGQSTSRESKTESTPAGTA